VVKFLVVYVTVNVLTLS